MLLRSPGEEQENHMALTTTRKPDPLACAHQRYQADVPRRSGTRGGTACNTRFFKNAPMHYELQSAPQATETSGDRPKNNRHANSAFLFSVTEKHEFKSAAATRADAALNPVVICNCFKASAWSRNCTAL